MSSSQMFTALECIETKAITILFARQEITHTPKDNIEIVD